MIGTWRPAQRAPRRYVSVSLRLGEYITLGSMPALETFSPKRALEYGSALIMSSPSPSGPPIPRHDRISAATSISAYRLNIVCRGNEEQQEVHESRYDYARKYRSHPSAVKKTPAYLHHRDSTMTHATRTRTQHLYYEVDETKMDSLARGGWHTYLVNTGV